MLIASLQSHFSGGTFTHFKRIANFRLSDTETLRREIQSFFKSNGLSKDNIVLGIPRKDIVMRYLDLPSEVGDNLKQVVRYQVQSFEPTEEDRFYYDYAVLKNSSAQKRLEILLVMVKKSLLDDHLRLLNELGIHPVAVVGSSMGLSNIFLQNRKDIYDKTYILSDIHTSSLEILALHHGAFVYSHEASRGEGQSWRDLILGEVDEATSKIRIGAEDTLENIILSGEASAAAHEELKILVPDCELLEKSLQISIPDENKPHLQEAASVLGLAYTGMARRPHIRMNMLPDELRRHQTRWAYVPAAIFGLVILALLMALGFHRMFQNQKLISRLDQELQAIKTPVEKVQSIRKQADELENKIKSYDTLLHKKDMNLEILRELTTLLPSDTYLSLYQYRDGKITLSGLSSSSSDLISKLEESPLLKNVVVKGPMFPDAQSGKDRFTFEAELEK